MINMQHLKHRLATTKATSIVAEQMQPPHAHITKVVGDKTAFAHDKKIRKSKRLRNNSMGGQTILTRQRKNINEFLHSQEGYSEVREMFRRVKDVH